MNLVQSQGREVVITVLTFVSRLEDMARGEEPFGADGPAAACPTDVATRSRASPEYSGAAAVSTMLLATPDPSASTTRVARPAAPGGAAW